MPTDHKHYYHKNYFLCNIFIYSLNRVRTIINDSLRGRPDTESFVPVYNVIIDWRRRQVDVCLALGRRVVAIGNNVTNVFYSHSLNGRTPGLLAGSLRAVI